MVTAQELMLTATRALAIYLLMLVVIRALGKRGTGSFAPFDLVVAVMLGAVVDEIIYGQVPLLTGTVAIVALAAAQASTAWLTWRDSRLHNLIHGTPTVIVRNGVLLPDGLRLERMSGRDVVARLRLEGIHDVREVKLAVVEDDGSVSVLRHGWAEPVRRAEVDGEAARQRDVDTDGRNEPRGPERTDASEWLR